MTANSQGLSDAEGQLAIPGDLQSRKVQKEICSVALIYNKTRSCDLPPLNLYSYRVVGSRALHPPRAQMKISVEFVSFLFPPLFGENRD